MPPNALPIHTPPTLQRSPSSLSSRPPTNVLPSHRRYRFQQRWPLSRAGAPVSSSSSVVSASAAPRSKLPQSNPTDLLSTAITKSSAQASMIPIAPIFTVAVMENSDDEIHRFHGHQRSSDTLKKFLNRPNAGKIRNLPANGGTAIFYVFKIEHHLTKLTAQYNHIKINRREKRSINRKGKHKPRKACKGR